MMLSDWFGKVSRLASVVFHRHDRKSSPRHPHHPRFEQLEPRHVFDANAGGTSRLLEAYGQTPLAFEANQGQTDPQVQFLSRGSGYTLFLTPTESVLSLLRPL